MTDVHVTTRRTGESIRIALTGELDISGVPAVERELEAAERAAPPLLVIDLSGLSFIDSTGLRTIVAADERARRAGRRLVIVPGPDRVHRVFRITLLDQRLHFVEDPGAGEGA